MKEVFCFFQFCDNVVSFLVGNYLKNVILIIDLVFVFVIYSGFLLDNFGMIVIYGYDGIVYFVGIVFGNVYLIFDNLVYDVMVNFMQVYDNLVYGVMDVYVFKYVVDGI